jgi:hypothetical protein
MRAVLAWTKSDGTFQEAFQAAEEARGYVLAERVITEATGLDKDTAAAGKVLVEANKWLASKLNHKFSDRQIIKHEHELSLKTDSELRAMVKAALVADGNLVNELDQATLASIGTILDAEVVE